MYFFSELQTETGIYEDSLYRYAKNNKMKIISGFIMPGNKFSGFGVSDEDADVIKEELAGGEG